MAKINDPQKILPQKTQLRPNPFDNGIGFFNNGNNGWINPKQTAPTKSKLQLNRKHSFLHCATMAKAIDGTQKSPPEPV